MKTDSQLVTPAIKSMPRTPIRGRSPGVGEPLSAAACLQPPAYRHPISSVRPPIRHSRAGGNPRSFPPPKNVNRDTTNYDHTDTPESSFPIGYPGDVIPLPDPASDSTAGGGANDTRIPSPCGAVHRGPIVIPETRDPGTHPRPRPHRRRAVFAPSGILPNASVTVAAYPGHPLSTRTEPHKQWYNQTYVHLMRYRPLTRQPRTIRKTCFCKTKVQIEARQESQ